MNFLANTGKGITVSSAKRDKRAHFILEHRSCVTQLL